MERGWGTALGGEEKSEQSYVIGGGTVFSTSTFSMCSETFLDEQTDKQRRHDGSDQVVNSQPDPEVAPLHVTLTLCAPRKSGETSHPPTFHVTCHCLGAPETYRYFTLSANTLPSPSARASRRGLLERCVGTVVG